MSFDTEVTVYVNSLGPEAALALREAAQVEQSQTEATQATRRGIKPQTSIIVDGREASLNDVRATSTVLLSWDYRAEVVKAAFEELRARSPYVSGTYQRSFFAMVDGRGLDYMQVPTPISLRNATVLEVTNNVRYARRLEVGVTESGRAFVKQVEPHIVESVSRQLRREFGSVAKISFGYVELASAYAAKTNAFRRAGDKDRGKGIAVTYPAIRIEDV